MIKKIIFDVDDTLIINDKSDLKDYVSVLNKYDSNKTMDDALELYKCIGEYELYAKKYDENTLLKFINNYFNKDYPIEFVKDILNAVSNWGKLPEDMIDVLNYLSEKYELYVLTNWFTNSQKKRLEKLNIIHYFKEFIGPEQFVKPDIESFEYFYKNCKPEQCVMIGDRYDVDIEVPIKLGMKAILYDYSNKYSDIDCIKIKSWKEIRDIL